MAQWQVTHSLKARGGYLALQGVQLYVRQSIGPEGLPTGRWRLYVDGKLEGEADGEQVARSAAELAFRTMVVGAEGAGRVAAAAGDGDRAA